MLLKGTDEGCINGVISQEDYELFCTFADAKYHSYLIMKLIYLTIIVAVNAQ